MIGFVPINEFTKKGRITSMRKIFQIGSNYPLQVINVSPEKGYVDLSKKHVTESESKQCEIKFKESKIADNIVKRTAELCSLPKMVIYQQYIWPLLSIKNDTNERKTDENNVVETGETGETTENKKEVAEKEVDGVEEVEVDKGGGEGEVERENEVEVERESEDDEDNVDEEKLSLGSNTALKVLQHFMFNPSLIIVQDASQDSIRTILLDLIRKKLQNTVKKISATVQLTCFGPEGINAIKEVLSTAEETSKTFNEILSGKNNVTSVEDTSQIETSSPSSQQPQQQPQPLDNDDSSGLTLHIYTLGCPEYSLNVETKNVEKGKEFLNLVISDIKAGMQRKNGGGFLLKREPFVLGEDN